MTEIKWCVYDNGDFKAYLELAVIEALREIAEQLAELNKHPTQHVEMHKIEPKS